MIDDVIATTTAKMDKTVLNLAHEFSTIRTGRASAAMLERIQVDYYGALTPITQLASVKSPEAHLLVIEPWDKQIITEVVKAIQKSDLGITPSNDGGTIRLPFPPLTEERRKELVKQCRHIAEEAKIALRNERRDANAKLERLIKDEDISKDDVHRGVERIQKLTDKHVVEVDETLKRKEAEVMEV
ncbi:MAG: ribosome recycling factor [Coriobacteriales bacterium]|jgi:ribosome recycling factor|nr:ribosome recycling factor [Coriobacteriales bacterium]